MGAGKSTPRAIDVQEDEETGVVQISDAVARRLLGQKEPVVKESRGKAQITDADRADVVRSIEQEYKQRLAAIEETNAQQYIRTKEEFAKAVEEVEQKFVKTTSSPICLELQQEVLKCYQSNPKQTLLCSPIVKAFNECVNKQREKLLIRQG